MDRATSPPEDMEEAILRATTEWRVFAKGLADATTINSSLSFGNAHQYRFWLPLALLYVEMGWLANFGTMAHSLSCYDRVHMGAGLVGDIAGQPFRTKETRVVS